MAIDENGEGLDRPARNLAHQRCIIERFAMDGICCGNLTVVSQDRFRTHVAVERHDYLPFRTITPAHGLHRERA